MSGVVRTVTKKVCLLGDFSVGKTSLVRRFVEGRFDERYLSTIGVKVDRKVLYLPDFAGGVELTLMLWDLAGGPASGPPVPAYYRGAAGAVIACDLTRQDTLPSIGTYAERFLEVNPAARFVMAANKVDLTEERQLGDQDLAGVAAAIDAPLFFTSAKTCENVESMFYQLGTLLARGQRG
jgi:small GTP-binding protein